MSTETTSFSARTALVTGSTGGLGVGIAEALADAGALVIVSGRDEARGQAVADRIESNGGKAAFVRADLVRGGDELTRLATEATAIGGGAIDILVNNAATWSSPIPTAEVTEQTIRDTLAVNVTAPFLLTGLVAPAMAQRGRGVVINIGSINGLKGFADAALYGATKATIHSLTKSWAAEYGPLGVRFNTVAPGPTLTDRTEAITDFLAPVLAQLPSRRMSTVAEVAAAVVFLAGDSAANIHGATLSVDGGWAAI